MKCAWVFGFFFFFFLVFAFQIKPKSVTKTT